MNWSAGSTGSGGRNASAESNKPKVIDQSLTNRFLPLMVDPEDLIRQSRNKEREDVLKSARFKIYRSITNFWY